MLERIVCVSRAVPGFSLNEVYGIIRVAHARNTVAGISGGLVFLDGWFAQVLEGRALALSATLARMMHDPRHRDFDLRARERALCRLFGGQALALRSQACIDPHLLDKFGYRPGFPVRRFPSDTLVEFMVQACRRDRAMPQLDRRRVAS